MACPAKPWEYNFIGAVWADIRDGEVKKGDLVMNTITNEIGYVIDPKAASVAGRPVTIKVEVKNRWPHGDVPPMVENIRWWSISKGNVQIWVEKTAPPPAQGDGSQRKPSLPRIWKERP